MPIEKKFDTIINFHFLFFLNLLFCFLLSISNPSRFHHLKQMPFWFNPRADVSILNFTAPTAAIITGHHIHLEESITRLQSFAPDHRNPGQKKYFPANLPSCKQKSLSIQKHRNLTVVRIPTSALTIISLESDLANFQLA